ncbi:hypothetical protein PR048_003168 [Dryococelus australis]|uniref:Uncharacterized protein n=1 Tax=Dryococelus australis TaxID=614101 RepID=A0ABQ9IM85_9NEOP|nr:hypothetical protein PR048_003168 [Dryococelus australis]
MWESYRTMKLGGGFSLGSPIPPFLHSDVAPTHITSTSSALKTSMKERGGGEGRSILTATAERKIHYQPLSLEDATFCEYQEVPDSTGSREPRPYFIAQCHPFHIHHTPPPRQPTTTENPITRVKQDDGLAVVWPAGPDFRLSAPPASLLASHQSETGSTPGFSHVGIWLDDAAGRRVFLGDLPFPPVAHSGAAPYSPQPPSSALKTSPNLFTHSKFSEALLNVDYSEPVGTSRRRDAHINVPGNHLVVTYILPGCGKNCAFSSCTTLALDASNCLAIEAYGQHYLSATQCIGTPSQAPFVNTLEYCFPTVNNMLTLGTTAGRITRKFLLIITSRRLLRNGGRAGGGVVTSTRSAANHSSGHQATGRHSGEWVCLGGGVSQVAAPPPNTKLWTRNNQVTRSRATPAKKSKLEIEDETGSEDDHKDSIDDNYCVDDSVDEVSDEKDDDSLNVPTHFTNEFPSTNGVKKAECINKARLGHGVKVKVTHIQYNGWMTSQQGGRRRRRCQVPVFSHLKYIIPYFLKLWYSRLLISPFCSPRIRRAVPPPETAELTVVRNSNLSDEESQQQKLTPIHSYASEETDDIATCSSVYFCTAIRIAFAKGWHVAPCRASPCEQCSKVKERFNRHSAFRPVLSRFFSVVAMMAMMAIFRWLIVVSVADRTDNAVFHTLL